MLPLPAGRFNDVIRLERRVSNDGLVSVGGNYYSVPDGARKRTLEAHSLAHEIRIYEEGRLLAVHPVLEGRRQISLLPAHRRCGQRKMSAEHKAAPLATAVLRRPLSFYDQVARRLAEAGRRV